MRPAAAIVLLCVVVASVRAQVPLRDAPPADLDAGFVAGWQNGEPVPGSKKAGASADFSVCVRTDGRSTFDVRAADWSLSLADQAIVFKMTLGDGRAVEMQTPRLKSPPRSVVASIRRDARQALSGLWIDGVEMASVAVAPGQTKWDSSALKTTALLALMYDRALTRPEIIEFGQTEQRHEPKPPFPGEFVVDDGEVISLLGGSEAVGLVESGWFESALMVFAAGKKVSVRDLSWEADTALRQDRPMNFGSLAQQLERTGTTTVILMFGRQDCIEMGPGRAQQFYDAMERIVRTCAVHTRRIVIVGPVPFEKKEPPLPDLSSQNKALSAYSEAAYAAAENGNCLFVDVLREWPQGAARWTTDGLTMTDSGHRVLADLMALHLWNGRPLDSTVQQLRKAIIEKNKLWHDYWRPSNWAFLHGDRTAQPSSRDHLNPGVRWFPAELEKYRDLITAKEKEIWKQAAEPGGKLP
ncbi:MAG: hypothetical protein K1X78_00040 [Verrucomicrobiaceae bacterium]|nr:hypothetical protein [Verrucomicrobiaceae bacterium]